MVPQGQARRPFHRWSTDSCARGLGDTAGSGRCAGRTKAHGNRDGRVAGAAFQSANMTAVAPSARNALEAASPRFPARISRERRSRACPAPTLRLPPTDAPPQPRDHDQVLGLLSVASVHSLILELQAPRSYRQSAHRVWPEPVVGLRPRSRSTSDRASCSPMAVGTPRWSG